MMSAQPDGSRERPLRVAIVGAGPAGFYTADALTKQKDRPVAIDLFERLPAPFGLVRYGVAPDHQKIKSVIRAYEKIAQQAQVRFFGNVRVCEGDLTLNEILAHYDQIVFAVGCETDRRLGIPGEDLAGSHAATSFVAWYNGHPSFADYPVSLDAERAAVIGVGDVAMDLTRLLVKSPEELRPTDMADDALAVFEQSKVREVLVIARRGPGQAAFAEKELQDIVALPDVDVIIDPTDIARAKVHLDALDGLARRKLAYLETVAARPSTGASRTVRFWFFRSPVSFIGQGGRVTGIELERTDLVKTDDGWLKAEMTGEREKIPLGLIFRSVGYRGVALEGVPFDERRGVIPNVEGRVQSEGTVLPRVYVAGWIKRGPSGVIGTNKSDAAATVAKMLEDATAEGFEGAPHASGIDAILASRGVRVVTFDEWKRLDAAEVEAGKSENRVRKKLTRLADMLARLGD